MCRYAMLAFANPFAIICASHQSPFRLLQAYHFPCHVYSGEVSFPIRQLYRRDFVIRHHAVKTQFSSATVSSPQGITEQTNHTPYNLGLPLSQRRE
jgi:hypothetical protein